jgi:lipopolysaccharide biosynthesis glycosyltransferase
MTNPDNDCIVVVCAADDNYAMPLAVTVRSALDNLDKSCRMILFIIDGGIREHNKQKLLQSLSSERCEVRWIASPDRLLGKFEVLTDFTIQDVPLVGIVKATKHVSIATYYRLLIPELLPKELQKAIYLDCDLVVVGDLRQLWDIEMGDNYLLATRALLIPSVSSPAGLVNYQALGIPADSKYFQPGIMVLNLEKWRDDNMSRKCVEYLQTNREDIRWHDSDVLNAMCANRWGELDPRWNRMTEIYTFQSWEDSPLSKEAFDEVLHHPYIIHFSSAAKPWNTREEDPFKHLWFKYVDRTAWSGWRFNLWVRGQRRLAREIQRMRKKISGFIT